MLPFEYINSKISPQIIKKEKFNIIKFDAPYNPEVKESEKIILHEYLSKTPKANLIFLHGIGNGHILYLKWFAEKFKDFGINTYFLILPFHLNRAPDNWKGGELFYSASPRKCEVRFHQAVVDVRRTIDYIESISNFPVYIMGFSFGGMISTLSMAVDKRIKKGVLAFTGGNWRWINWYSPYTESIRIEYKTIKNEMGCYSEEYCAKMRGNPEKVISKFKEITDIFKYPVGCYHYDPMAFAKFVNQKVLMFTGLFDKVINKKSSDSLYKMLPNAKRIFIPAGHKSSYLFRKYVAWKTKNFLFS
ncbi:alpha/beta hydrolase family protein [Thermosipho atlanticus]|uniref:Alpha/beta hydrolase family protein n=1 Tax=Thermosipho atlanticus DSM 15807 TaxID=1123380 RepID=A0A1M5TLB7_9BACT|nr:alpha/beta hydrolase [Thermosipho atlanticus]SHH51469.1 Alpha/beta hydrolase family protein [Thermosipho atlanticus DSM 15807]